MSTILKWAGNKTAIMPELIKHLPAGQRLVEPFAGSCAVMMATDYPHYLVADINPDLINLYKKIALDCEAFISRAKNIFAIANREVAYYNIRHEFNHSSEITDFMKAVYFLYLNRHGYRGLCRYNLSGHFNVPYGNYKNPYFPENEIRAFAKKAQRATFICASYDETLAMLRAGMWFIVIRHMTAHLAVITLPVLPGTISTIWRLFLNAGHQKVIRLLCPTATPL